MMYNEPHAVRCTRAHVYKDKGRLYIDYWGIAKDWLIVENDKRFTQAIATTHCNEFQEVRNYSKYYSDSPFAVKKRD